MGNALEKNKGGKGVRVGKFVVLIRVFRAGLAETFMVAAGGGAGWLGVVGTQAVTGVCEVIFAHKVLPKSVFANISLSLILVPVGSSPLKSQPPWRPCMLVSKLNLRSLCVSLLALTMGEISAPK